MQRLTVARLRAQSVPVALVGASDDLGGFRDSFPIVVSYFDRAVPEHGGAHLRRPLSDSAAGQPQRPSHRPVSAAGLALFSPVTTLSSLRDEVANARKAVSELQARVKEERQRAEQELAALVRQAGERARLAGMPFARLGSDSLVLEGPSRLRLNVARLSIGEAVEHPVTSRLGVIESATADPRIQALWDSLHGHDGSADDEGLRGAPSTVLDIPGAVVRSEEERPARARAGARFACPFEPRPRARALRARPASSPYRNSRSTSRSGSSGTSVTGCWTACPRWWRSRRSRPPPGFSCRRHCGDFSAPRSNWSGCRQAQAVAWDGAPVECARLLVFESDGRAGGRPLSALLETRRLLTLARHHGFRQGHATHLRVAARCRPQAALGVQRAGGRGAVREPRLRGAGDGRLLPGGADQRSFATPRWWPGSAALAWPTSCSRRPTRTWSFC